MRMSIIWNEMEKSDMLMTSRGVVICPHTALYFY